MRQYRAAAQKKIDAGESTNALTRLVGLVASICGFRTLEDARILDLRYQLFSGLAGTLATAADARAGRGVFLVHEFVTDATAAVKVKANAADLYDFATSALGVEVPREGNWCVGPFTVPGSERLPSDLPLWIGKLTSSQP